MSNKYQNCPLNIKKYVIIIEYAKKNVAILAIKTIRT